MMMYKNLSFEMKSSTDDKEAADIYIYDNVGESWKDTETNTSTAKAFRKILDSAGDIKKLNLHINSCGGACDDGVAIYSMLKQHSAEKTAYIDGYACSIASLIAAACDRVIMSCASAMQIHNALTFAYGNAKTMRAMADTLDKITSGIKAAYLDRAGDKLTAEKLSRLMDGKDGDGTWLTASECMRYGFCDEVMGKTENNSESETEPISDPEPKIENKNDLINTFRSFML